jgi:hypothetical protein
MGVRGEIFSTKVALQNRTYFFNVKENRLGDLFLNIVESKNRDEGGFERQSVILFADDLQDFLKGFDESLRVLEKEAREKRRGTPDRGERPSRFQSERPSKFEGERPSRFQSERPARFQGERPSRFQSERPRRFQGERPARFQGERPSRFQGERQTRFQGERPSRFQSERPSRFHGEREDQSEYPKRPGSGKSNASGKTYRGKGFQRGKDKSNSSPPRKRVVVKRSKKDD